MKTKVDNIQHIFAWSLQYVKRSVGLFLVISVQLIRFPLYWEFYNVFFRKPATNCYIVLSIRQESVRAWVIFSSFPPPSLSLSLSRHMNSVVRLLWSSLIHNNAMVQLYTS